MSVESLITRNSVHVGTLRNLCIAHWRGSPGPGHLRAMHEATASWSETGPGSDTVLLNVMLDAGERPSFPPDVRAELEAFFRDHSLFLLGVAHVFEIRGLAGATLRSVLNTTFLLTRPPNPNQAYADVEAAFGPVQAWLAGAGDGDPSWTTAQVRDAEREARAMALASWDLDAG